VWLKEKVSCCDSDCIQTCVDLPSGQQDAHELLAKLLDYSPQYIQNLFYLYVTRQKTFQLCGHQGQEPLLHENILSLELKGHNVITCLDAYFNVAQKPNLEIGKCSTCNIVSTTYTPHVTISLDKELPPVLILHLKRFSYDVTAQRTTKNCSNIDLPEILDISNYMFGCEGIDSDKKCYELLAVCCHLGEFDDSGHFVTIGRTVDIKTRKLSEEWRKYDDDKYPVISQLPPFFTGDEFEDTRTPYILFYMQKFARLNG
jgi:ubiquitin C-terminal hydrolase